MIVSFMTLSIYANLKFMFQIRGQQYKRRDMQFLCKFTFTCK